MKTANIFLLIVGSVIVSVNSVEDASSLFNENSQINNILGTFMDVGALEDVLFDLVTQIDYETLQTILGIYKNFTSQLNDLLVNGFNTTELCNYVDNSNISLECKKQAEIICRNTSLMLTFLDASSKLYPGTYYASKLDYGNFDECLSIDYWKNGTRILGKFCANGLIIPTVANGSETEIFKSAYKLSLCIPDLCTAQDILNLFRAPADLPLVNDKFSSTKETDADISMADLAVGTIFLAFVILMTITTSYEFYLQRNGRKPKNELFIAFSLVTNINKLMKIETTSSKEQIPVIHGLKFISMMWIIAGHGFLGLTYGVIPMSNNKDYESFQWTRYTQYVTTAYLGVDTFFFISGFLLAYQYLKHKETSFKRNIVKVPFLYFHRYLRLTPALLMLYLYNITLNDHTGLAPMSHYARENLIKEPCFKYWWSFFLYIQNYYNYNDVCITPTWYLSADMQMFLVAPLVLIPVALQVKKNFRLVMTGLFILNMFLTVAPIFIGLYFRNYRNNFDTHSRLINFFMGLMLAALMREKISFVIGEKLNVFIWTITLLGMFAVVLCYQEVEINHGFVTKTVFHCLRRPIWCLGLWWIVYACHHGHGGIITWILTRDIFQIGGKLTYCMYLLHSNIIAIYVYNVKDRMHFGDYEVFYLFCGHFILTWGGAVFWTLAFESPLITIQKTMFQRQVLDVKPVPNFGSIVSSNTGSEIKEPVQNTMN